MKGNQSNPGLALLFVVCLITFGTADAQQTNRLFSGNSPAIPLSAQGVAASSGSINKSLLANASQNIDLTLPDGQLLTASSVDLLEGRLMVDAGRFESGRTMLSRFIEQSPGNGNAYLARARAHWSLNLPLEAAKDYQAAINLSERPSPGIHRALIISLVASGPEQSEAATTAVTEALNRHSREITLLGLAVDLALSNNEARLALSYFTRVPNQLEKLPQWQFRRALWACLSGDKELATDSFSSLVNMSMQGSNAYRGTWRIPQILTRELSHNPTPDNCTAAAWQNILELEP
jgi:tetratricopeptide (TPR) repeat protein